MVGRRTTCVGQQYDDASSDVGSDVSDDVGRMQDAGRESDERPTKVRWKSDGSWTSKAQQWQVVALEHDATVRPAKRCSSLLRQGRQCVATRYCGDPAMLCSSLLQRWLATPAALQFAALLRDRQRVASRCYGDGRQRCNLQRCCDG